MENKNDFFDPLSDMAKSAVEYLDIRLDDLKLSAVEGLSKGFGRFMSGIVIIQLLIVGFTLAGLACILLLGELMGSYALAAFLVAAVFVVVSVLLYVFKEKVFVAVFRRIFASVFFKNKDISNVSESRNDNLNRRQYKEQELELRAQYLKAYYSPANLYNHFFNKITPLLNITGLLAGIYEKLKSGATADAGAEAAAEAGDATGNVTDNI